MQVYIQETAKKTAWSKYQFHVPGWIISYKVISYTFPSGHQHQNPAKSKAKERVLFPFFSPSKGL